MDDTKNNKMFASSLYTSNITSFSLSHWIMLIWVNLEMVILFILTWSMIPIFNVNGFIDIQEISMEYSNKSSLWSIVFPRNCVMEFKIMKYHYSICTFVWYWCFYQRMIKNITRIWGYSLQRWKDWSNSICLYHLCALWIIGTWFDTVPSILLISHLGEERRHQVVRSWEGMLEESPRASWVQLRPTDCIMWLLLFEFHSSLWSFQNT